MGCLRARLFAKTKEKLAGQETPLPGPPAVDNTRSGLQVMSQKRTRTTKGRRVEIQSSRLRSGGFTLTELLVVIVIIGIIITLILTAAQEGVRRAEERATQSLIAKLDEAINDRLSALLQTQPDPLQSHNNLAGIYSSTYTSGYVEGPQRATVIALYDYVKRELPDVFYVQDPGVYSNPPTLTSNYPLNFAANRFGSNGDDTDFWLPLGWAAGTVNQVEGIYGASYYAAAGIYKNLGYLPAGYDGVDNNANGLVDEVAEGAPTTAAQQAVAVALSNHQHKTARAEMLYALLVEGQGPLGSVFNRDDFTDKEVKDTDGDGLPEFVDAWGEPLQFYRWPVLYHSAVQRGQVILPGGEQSQVLDQPYNYVWEEREQDPLDQNQQLVAPAWWYATLPAPVSLPSNDQYTSVFSFPGPVSSDGRSGGVLFFEYFFHRLTEPMAIQTPGRAWDRSGNYRRAFFTKFLIVSSGPDGLLGLFRYNDTTIRGLINSNPTAPAPLLIFNENSAMPYVFDYSQTSYAPYQSPIQGPSSNDPNNPNSYDLQQNGMDDVSNHNLQTDAGGGN